MDFVFGLLKQLAASLTPLEFLLVMVLIVVIVMFALKQITKSSKGGLIGLLTGDSGKIDKVDTLTTKVDAAVATMITRTEFDKSIGEIKQLLTVGLSEILHEARDSDEHLTENLTSINQMRAEFDKTLGLLQKQMDDMQHHMKMHDVHDETQFTAIKDSLHRSQDLLNKIVTQVEKVDEYLKTTAPEFRAYHKDLTRELGQLSKDIGIMDRVLQAQINNGKSGITLR